MVAKDRLSIIFPTVYSRVSQLELKIVVDIVMEYIRMDSGTRERTKKISMGLKEEKINLLVVRM